MRKKLLFVFNPKAGKGKLRSYLMDIINIFNQHGYEVTAYATQKARDAADCVMEYGGKTDLIVCSGGDGTLDEVVTGLMQANLDTPVGYIPTGSTNDFANSLFLPKDPLEVARNIMEQNVYRCDVGRFNEQTFTYIAAFGLFTDVSYDTPQDMKNVLGHVAYLLNGFTRLFDIKSYRMTVESNGEILDREFIFGMITNSRSVGGFKNLTRDVDMNDGLFEVTLIEMPENPLEMQQIVTALLMEDDNLDKIHTFKSSRLDIASAGPVPWTLDGEYGGRHEHVVIENRQQALHLFLTSTKED